MSIFVVNTIADSIDNDNFLSLREAITAANITDGIDTIVFDISLDGETLDLFSALPTIIEELTLDASDLSSLTIDANQGGFRVLTFEASEGDFTIDGLTITGGNPNSNGGGIFSNQNLFINNSTVSGNSTIGDNSDGGGIFSSSNITLTNSNVLNNSTTDSLSSGGGIASSENIFLTNSTVSGNSTIGFASSGGGIISSGDTFLTNSTVSDNSTNNIDSFGGGIVSLGSTTLTNSTVSGNSTSGSSSFGGGISSLGTTTLTNSTIFGNSTTGDDSTGGGIFSVFSTLNNSIIIGNTSAAGNPDISGFASSNGFNIIGDLTGSIGFLPEGETDLPVEQIINPTLADNGGPTFTHALVEGSIAIDAGNNDDAVIVPEGDPLLTDQRGNGFDRIINEIVDIGAFEFLGVSTTIPEPSSFGGIFTVALLALVWTRKAKKAS